MRKTIFGVGNSLDNFIARRDAAMDWVRLSDEVMKIMQTMFRTIDTVVMGRRTYEATIAMGSPLDFDARIYVCSRTPAEGADPRVTMVTRDAVELLGELRRTPGKDICVMGGGELARSLLEARMIDEFHVTIHPVLLGAGVPLFLPLKRQIDLDLLEVRQLPGGCVGLSYRVT